MPPRKADKPQMNEDKIVALTHLSQSDQDSVSWIRECQHPVSVYRDCVLTVYCIQEVSQVYTEVSQVSQVSQAPPGCD